MASAGPVLAAALAAATLLADGAEAASQTAPPTAPVHTRQGDVAGVTVGRVESFKGLPFAAPPVGDLRWRPPQPGPTWTGVRDASAFGAVCEQPSRIPGGLPMSEDCLTLNVWRPAGARPGAALPVMVWIYGGAFVYGAGSVPIYDGTRFAEDGVMLVTFNYRVGRFGFFAHPALDAGASAQAPVAKYGLMDQIAALKWVRANIAAFGGDAHNVTVFGESAGAISVNYLMTSPAARGLFDKAIAESGFGRSRPRPLAAAEAVGEQAAAAAGIRGDDAAAAAALRALPASRLVVEVGLADPALPNPIADGQIIPPRVGEAGIEAAFARGEVARVPYLEGGNSYEASLFPRVADFPGPVIARAGDPARVVALYGARPAPEVARELVTDTLVTEPDRALARDMARLGLPAFVYHFSYVPAAARAGSFGAAHGSEIAYVFDTLPTHPLTWAGRDIPARTAEDEKIAGAMHAYWVAFARTGDPGAAGGPAWPRYTLEAGQGGDQGGDRLLEFGADGVHVRAGFEAPRLDLIQAVVEKRAPTAP